VTSSAEIHRLFGILQCRTQASMLKWLWQVRDVWLLLPTTFLAILLAATSKPKLGCEEQEGYRDSKV
jgi:hypothetical protein